MPNIVAFERTLAEVQRVVDGVGSHQLDDPTPCPGWNVRALIAHLIEVNREYAAVASGDPVPDHGVDPTGSRTAGGDLAEAFRRSGERARTIFAQPGLVDRRFAFPWGEEPGGKIVRHVANELLIHGWDLATATGQPRDFPPDLAEASLASWRAWFAEFPRDAQGNFGPERPAPADAPAADRLAAFLGRDV